MSSSFGSKRKARKIQVDEDEEMTPAVSEESLSSRRHSWSKRMCLADIEDVADSFTGVSSPPSNVTRKPFKKSSLRQSIAFDDEESSAASEPNTSEGRREGSERNGHQNMAKSSKGSSSLITKRKKAASSRLSFGPGEIISGDAAEALEENEQFTPKKIGHGRKKGESGTLRKSLPTYHLPSRGGDEDEERPTYSKDYLNQLKSSTPSTPKDLQTSSTTFDDEEGLDESELEGAMIVDSDMETIPASLIPSEAEIREKKARRARLAHEADFISLDSPGDGQHQLSLLPRKPKTETRLVREDEDIIEGFEEFVDDGRISLGKKAEREAKKRHRAQMAEMIHDAEGSSSDPSDDSEAERHAAYEAAQTRAGMDGLTKPNVQALPQVPPKITPLLSLGESLQRLRTTMSGMEMELAKRTRRMEELKKEKAEILEREVEVQRLLKEAGDRYSAMRADAGLAGMDPNRFMSGQNGFGDVIGSNRGLESFGNTPVGRPQIEDIG